MSIHVHTEFCSDASLLSPFPPHSLLLAHSPFSISLCLRSFKELKLGSRYAGIYKFLMTSLHILQ